MLRIAVDRLPELFAKMAESKVLYLPIEKNDQVEFYPWNENETVRLDKLNTLKSAKDLFFPQTESMMKFKMQGKTISVEEDRAEVKPFAIFGVRACDAKSFEILDRVFLAEPVDTFYKARRDRILSVIAACPHADRLTIREENAGLHFLVKVDTALSDRELTGLLDKAGIRVYSLGAYYHGPVPEEFRHHLIVNYAGLTDGHMDKLEHRLQCL